MSLAVIKMEGGTDHDLRILDMPTEEEENKEKSASASAGDQLSKREDVKVLSGEGKPSGEKDKSEKVRVYYLSKLINFLLLKSVNASAGGE